MSICVQLPMNNWRENRIWARNLEVQRNIYYDWYGTGEWYCTMATETEQQTTRGGARQLVQPGETYGMSVSLPHLTPGLNEQIEGVISSHEQGQESKIFDGEDGIVPRVKRKDFIYAVVVGVILTLYLFLIFAT